MVWLLLHSIPPLFMCLETHLNGRTLRLEEVYLCKKSVLHSGPTEIQKNSRLRHGSPRGADCSVYGEKTKSKSVLYFSVGLGQPLPFKIKR